MAASRKLYEPMAKTIRYHVEHAGTEKLIVIDQLVRDIAYDLKKDNPNFDRDRFIEACGL